MLKVVSALFIFITFLLLVVPVRAADCSGVPSIPITVEPTSGNQLTQFHITLLWENLSEEDFNKYQTIDVKPVAYNTADDSPIGTADDIGTTDIASSRQRKNKTIILSNFFIKDGTYTVKIRLLANTYYLGCEAETHTIQLTAGSGTASLKAGDKCDINLQSLAGYKCPTGLKCVQNGAAGYTCGKKDPNDKTCTQADIDSGKCTRGAGQSCTTNDGEGIQTAIGCIHTDPQGLIKDTFRLAVGIGGGIAFLLMVWGAFEMVTSAGNPDNLKNGQQRFINAIIGILFIVFSTLLLQIIGVDILGIPGFIK